MQNPFHQIVALVEAGWRVLVPAPNNSGERTRPGDLVSHTTEEQVAEAIGLVRALGVSTFCAVGHDWGGAMVWWLAQHHPETLHRGVVLSCPHPAVLHRSRATWWSAQESWYRRFYRASAIPPGGCGGVPEMLRPLVDTQPAPPSGATASHGLRAVLNWHRVLASAPHMPPQSTIRVPLRLICGAEDAMFGASLADTSGEACTDVDVVELEGASHWVHCERPQHVSELITAFLGG